MPSPHERLLAYREALAAAIALDRVAHAIPPVRADLRDQLLRASTSIVLNLAEGASEFSPAEKLRFYRMSRRSGAECAAILDLCHVILGLDVADAATRTDRTTLLLTRLIAATDQRRAKT